MTVAEQLDHYHDLYNRPDFIPNDPIGLVHGFTDKQDREIIGFWVAILAWGRRQTIIDKGLQLIELMDGRPHHFILNHTEEDHERFADWKHRTFNFEDTKYFLRWLQNYYRQHDSLEDAFARHLKRRTKPSNRPCGVFTTCSSASRMPPNVPGSTLPPRPESPAANASVCT